MTGEKVSHKYDYWYFCNASNDRNKLISCHIILHNNHEQIGKAKSPDLVEKREKQKNGVEIW